MRRKQHDPKRIFSLRKTNAKLSDLKFLQDPCTGSKENGFASKIPAVWVSSEVRGFATAQQLHQTRCHGADVSHLTSDIYIADTRARVSCVGSPCRLGIETGISERDALHPDVGIESGPEVTCLRSSCLFLLAINRVYVTTPHMDVSGERSPSHSVSSVWAPEVNGCFENVCERLSSGQKVSPQHSPE